MAAGDEGPKATPTAPTAPLDELSRQVDRGSLFLHDALSRYAGRINELVGYLQVVLDLMQEKGLVTADEVTERFARALRAALDDGRDLRPQIQLRVDPPRDQDDDPPPVNCAERLHICKAVCCTLDFALSAQEVEAGKVRWDLGRPYLIRHDRSGYCCHNTAPGRQCGIYGDRPLSCQRYSCANDERIWKDFERMELNEEWIAENAGGGDPRLYTS